MRDGGSSLGSGSSRRTVVRDVCGDAGRYGGSYLNSLYHLATCMYVIDLRCGRAGRAGHRT